MAADAAEPAVQFQHTRGGHIPGHDGHAYSLRSANAPPIPIVIAAPHAGREYPGELLAQMRAPALACRRLEDRYVDHIAAPLAHATGASLLMAHAPRAMIDLNRSSDDVDWGMVSGAKEPKARHSLVNRRSRSGLGLVPRRIPGLGEIWRGPITRDILQKRISGIYQPYHSALGKELERVRDMWGKVLLIDLHSMPPLRPATPQDRTAEFVIGDRFGASCDPGLIDLSLRYLGAHGRRTAHNRPYAGGYILDRYGQTARGIHAVQIEICRATYLDAALDMPSARTGAIVRLLTGLVRSLAAEVAAMGSHTSLGLAAE